MHTRRCVLSGPSATQQTRLAQVYPVNYYRIYEIKTTPAAQYYTRKKNITLFNEIFDTYMYFHFNPTVCGCKKEARILQRKSIRNSLFASESADHPR